MADAPVLRVVAQRYEMDCGVACLAMICGVTYENALVAIAQVRPDVCMIGVHTKHLLAAAKMLGCRFNPREKRRVDFEQDTGVLTVSSARWATPHLVVLKDGLIIDTDATIWDADVFMSAYAAHPLSLLSLSSKG